MIIRTISIKNFRNIKEATVSFGERVNLFYGDNAQGKTNFIEAVFLLSAAKGFRTSRDAELIRFGCDEASAEACFYAKESERTLGIKLRAGRKKQIFYDGIPMKRAADIMGAFSAVLFAPQHLGLIKEGPAVRRSMIDFAVSARWPRYMDALVRYLKVLDQKRSLLKEERPDRELLTVYDRYLASCGGFIEEKRAEYLKKLLPYACEYYGGISGKEKMEAKAVTCLDGMFAPDSADKSDISSSSAEEYIYKGLLSRMDTEIAAKSCLFGPHKDDIEIFIDGNPAKSFASQGQQKSAAIALKLAECDMVKEYSGEYPVLMLDDILSELDESRRGFILSKIEGLQVVITACEGIEGFSEGRRWSVSNGTFRQV